MIPVYTGWDDREEVGWHAFVSSVQHRTSEVCAFVPLSGKTDGSNAFTQARFLVPFLQRFKGWAIFADAADMVCLDDIAKLWELRDPAYAVQVVKHDYQTKHPRKFLGTKMESPNIMYPRKNWASLMLMNCEHDAWRRLDASDAPGLDLLQFKFLFDDEIGSLPVEWNWLADEFGANPDAKIVHHTAGTPGFPAYADAPMADVWRREHARANYATP